MRVFRSKIDTWLGLVILVSVLVCLAITMGMALIMSLSGRLFSMMVLAMGVVLPLWILLGTRYLVSQDSLVIKSGPFRWHIPISAITRVRKTKNPISSPALSLDRLQIQYQPGKSIMVSPKDKQAFLSAINQEIG